MLRSCLLPLSLVCAISSISAQGGIPGAPPQQPGDGAAPLSRSGNVGPQAALVIVPQLDANRMTRRGNSIPWSWTPTHFQAIYEGTEMPPALVIGCIGLRTYRSDTGATVDMEIKLGYTKKDHHTMTTNYATNLDSGTPVTVFKRQKYKFPNNAPRNNTNPAFFQVQIPLDTKFVWTRQPGRNIIVIVKVWGNTNNNRSFSWFPENSSAGSTGARLYSNNNVNATTGFRTLGLAPVMSFDTKCKINAVFTAFGKGCQGTGGHAGHIVPVVARTRFLNTANAWTFGSGPQRWQQQINGSQMPRIPTQFISMTERDDSVARTAAASTLTLKIEFGNTARTSSTMTNNYASNRTSTMKVVFTGNVNLPAVSGGNKDINKFVYVVPFKAPYLFLPDARNPNFLIDIANTTAVRGSRFPDAESGTAAQGTRVYANGNPTATTGILNRNHCMAICFGLKGNGTATPVHSLSSPPVVGKTWGLDVASARQSSGAALFIGVSKTKWLAFNLPLDLKFLGAAGCFLNVSPDMLFATVTNLTGSASVKIAIPANLTSLIGKELHSQFLILDGPANAAGVVTTNGGTNKFGEQ